MVVIKKFPRWSIHQLEQDWFLCIEYANKGVPHKIVGRYATRDEAQAYQIVYSRGGLRNKWVQKAFKL